MDEIATAYVKPVLSVGQRDADYADAYHGPAEWRSEASPRLPSDLGDASQ